MATTKRKMQVRFTDTVEITVTVEVDEVNDDYWFAEEVAEGRALALAKGFLDTIGTQTGDPRISAVASGLDGVGADGVLDITDSAQEG